MRTRFYWFTTSLFFFILGVILSQTYRAYIYSNNIFDFYIADSIGNLVAVPSATCFYLAFSKRRPPISRIVLLFVLTFIGYEFLGVLNFHGVFDYYDIIATILSGCVTYFILSRIESKVSN